ncbi:unnamed protein product [Brassica oleracea]
MFRFWRRGSILMLATLGRIFSGYRNRKGWIGRSIAQHTRGCGAADEDPKGGHLPALIKKLADESGNHVVFIHMDDQLDEKTLVGTYVCTDQPGEFKWLPGSLTQAIMNGFWVVLEDIDKAPSDVPLVLSPLLGGSCSFVTSHGEVPSAHTPLDMVSVLAVKLYFSIFAETYEKVNSALRPQFSGSATENSATFSSPSSFSLRDLLKLCERVQGLPSYDGHAISLEAADIFSASYMSTQNRATVSEIVASVWNVLVPESQHKPPIQELSKTLKIGRVSLPLGETASHDRSRFVETRTSTRLLEKIARSVEYNEPVLLVGETGTGKTTLVQNLAQWIGQKLTVLVCF